jgi:hypothetical protein
MKTNDFYRIEETNTLTICYGVYTPERALMLRKSGYSFTVFSDHLEGVMGEVKVILGI